MSMSLVEQALDMTYVSDPDVASSLRRLVGLMDTPYDNLVVRWAVMRSLAEGPLATGATAETAGGKELRGRTLFGSADGAALILAQLFSVEGPVFTGTEVRALVLAHWSRGQLLLNRELDEVGGDADALLSREVERLLGPELTEVDFAREILGQSDLALACEALVAQARSHADGVPLTPLLVVGPRHSGRTHSAEVLTRALGGDIVRVSAAVAPSKVALRRILRDHSVGASRLAVIAEDLDSLAPEVVRTLSALAKSGRFGARGGPTVATSVVATSVRATRGWHALEIEPYERDAVAAILRSRHGWHIELRRLIALAGRLRPGLALLRAAQLEEQTGTPRIADRHATAAMQTWGLDRLGLTAEDRATMTALTSGGQVSLSHLAVTVGVDEERLSEEVLPYLVELKLVAKARGQWAATESGTELYGKTTE